MTGYLGSLIAVGAVVAISSLISYGGECDKTVKSAIGIIILCTLISPLMSLLGSASALDINELFNTSREEISIEDSLYYKTAEESFAVGVKRLLCEEMGLSSDDVTVHIEGFDATKMRAERITVILSGKGAYADYHRVIESIRTEGLGECEVKLEFGG